jgi:hypothetical protein
MTRVLPFLYSYSLCSAATGTDFYHTFLFLLILEVYIGVTLLVPIPLAVWYNAQVCDHPIAGIAGSNPAEGMDVRLLCLLCVV